MKSIGKVYLNLNGTSYGQKFLREEVNLTYLGPFHLYEDKEGSVRVNFHNVSLYFIKKFHVDKIILNKIKRKVG